jgi:hypothetical protein
MRDSGAAEIKLRILHLVQSQQSIDQGTGGGPHGRPRPSSYSI